MGQIYRFSIFRDFFYAQIWMWTAHKLQASFSFCLHVLFRFQIWRRRTRRASIGAKIILNGQRGAELQKKYVLSVPFWQPPPLHTDWLNFLRACFYLRAKPKMPTTLIWPGSKSETVPSDAFGYFISQHRQFCATRRLFLLILKVSYLGYRMCSCQSLYVTCWQ